LSQVHKKCTFFAAKCPYMVCSKVAGSVDLDGFQLD